MIPEARVPPETCEDGWHVSKSGRKRCDCGETRNASYRNWWQRKKDKWEFNRLQRWLHRNGYR